MQSRSRLTAIGAGIFIGLLCAGPVFAGGMTTNTFRVVEDSANAIEWAIGDTLSTGVGLRVDIDTSVVYEAKYWETMTVEAKFRPFVFDLDTGATRDSGAVTMILQMSNDALYWTDLDSLVAVDSLAAFKVFTMLPYRYARYIVHQGVKTDSAGVRGTMVVHTTGRW